MSDIKRIYVDASSVITSGENNLVDLKTADGKVYKALEPRRLFPVSRGDVYITLLDGEEKEVALIRDVSELESKSAKVIESSLNDYYLVPYISAILSASELPAELSFESRMACGMGACLTCTCHTTSGARRICSDGPVFEREDIIWTQR